MKNEKGQEIQEGHEALTFDEKLKIMDLAITANQSILEMVDLIINDEPRQMFCSTCGNKFNASK